MAKKAFKRKSAKEKKEEVEKLLQKLDEGVKNFEYDPEKYKAILKMQTLTPDYTFRNLMLARAQLPNARFLAPFKRWEELGRSIILGEKAIRILAPRFIKKKDENTGEEDTKLIGYVSVPVFDVSQTEGEPLPIDRVKLTLDGESEEAVNIFEWVKILAEEDHCPVILDRVRGANGYYNISSHKIVIDENLSLNHRAKTAVHELVHSRVHKNITASTSEERECVAEGTAYIICTFFGLDTSSFSFEYVRSWSKDNGDSLMNYGAIIQKTAHTLINDFERVAGTFNKNKVVSLYQSFISA